jgi:hypothetical protein
MVSSITNVFETGKYTTQLLRIDSCSHTQDGTILVNLFIIRIPYFNYNFMLII